MEKYGIEQFDGRKYDHWKFRMEIILDQNDVKEYIEQRQNLENVEAAKKDKKCKSILIQCISNSQLEYVKDKNTAFDMWEGLKHVFQRKGIASQLYLRKKLLAMRYVENEPLKNHFIKFEETVRELKSVGAKVEELDIISHLLLTLPKSYDSIVTALETLEMDKLSLEFVKTKPLDQKINRKNGTSKFDKKAEVNILLGYVSNAYRLWNSVSRKITIARDVICDEYKTIKDIRAETSDKLTQVESISEEDNNKS